jgi:hypothetical protein
MRRVRIVGDLGPYSSSHHQRVLADDRRSAVTVVAITVRNGLIGRLHAGQSSALLEDPGLSRITDAENEGTYGHCLPEGGGTSPAQGI